MKPLTRHVRVRWFAAAATVSLLGVALPAHPAPARSPRHADQSRAVDLELGSDRGAGFSCVSLVTPASGCLETMAGPSDKDHVETSDLTDRASIVATGTLSVPQAREISGDAPIRSTVGGPAGWIAFTSNRDGSAHVWVMRTDGTEQKELTSGPTDDIEPTWSKDGAIAFSRGTGYNQSNFVQSTIWVMAADGTAAHALPAPANTINYRPSWSPDGQRIAFVRAGTNGVSPAEVWVMNRDGADQHRVATGTFPGWSPDGTRLAYECVFDICSIALDGSGPKQLTQSGDALAPNWYPGNRIVYARSIGTGLSVPGGPSTKARQIFVINPDGSGVTKVTHDSDNDIFPAWSSDGQAIAFSQATNSAGTLCCGNQIAAVNPDGSQERVLTNASPAEPFLGESFPTYEPL